MCVGVCPSDAHLPRAIARRPAPWPSCSARRPVATASAARRVLASAAFDEGSAAMRPSVQIGDPFAGKLLIEASLELVERRPRRGLQDLGAAGLTCATSEMADAWRHRHPHRSRGRAAARDRHGALRGDDQRVAGADARDRGAGARRRRAQTSCRRWGLPSAVVGRVTGDGDVVVVAGGRHRDRPRSRRGRWPAMPGSRSADRLAATPTPRTRPRRARRRCPTTGCRSAAWTRVRSSRRCSATPNLGSRAWVTTQYDQTVGTDTVEGCDRAAAVLRIKGTQQGPRDGHRFAACASRIHDPALGAALAVAECARNVAITGARPLGVTNCLNFGDPSNPRRSGSCRSRCAAWVKLAAHSACRSPAATSACTTNRLSDASRRPRRSASSACSTTSTSLSARSSCNEGDLVVLLGRGRSGHGRLGIRADRRRCARGSAAVHRSRSRGALQKLARVGGGGPVLASAQDVSGGGLAVALAECAIWGGHRRGSDARRSRSRRPSRCSARAPARVVVTIAPERWNALARLASGMRVACRRLGTVGGDRLRIRLVGVGATGAAEERGAGVADELDVPLTELRRAWNRALPTALGRAGPS